MTSLDCIMISVFVASPNGLRVLWRVSDRLSDKDMRALVAAFDAGTRKRELAERFGISESSVKRLIRKDRR